MLISDDLTFVIAQKRYADAFKQASSIKRIYANQNQIATYTRRDSKSGYRVLTETDGSISFNRYDSNAVLIPDKVVPYAQLINAESPGSIDSKPA
jgi:hypothetical protein